MYLSLNDAKQYETGLQEGCTRIFYVKPEFIGRFSMVGEMPTADELDQTHIELGRILETDMIEIFRMLQSENWSPNDEAKFLLEQKGLVHTNMSKGDVIVVHEHAFVVAPTSFESIGIYPD